MSHYPLLQKLPDYIALTRLNRPIGIWLLMWPMLWSLWFAAEGVPRPDVLIIFVLGTILTRSAGCAINDFADRDFDAHVQRTRQRPLATGALSAREALGAAGVLMILAFLLVLLTNPLTIALSFVALLLAVVYPFTKRVTHWPQAFLGAAFAFAIPMAFAAQTNALPAAAWWLFFDALIWAMAYDTLYAMADREDDLRIGIRSTAILFGRYDILATAVLHLVTIALLAWIGQVYARHWIFTAGLLIATVLAARQWWQVRDRDRQACFDAFLANNTLGMVIFIALVLDYLVYPAGAR